MIYTCYEMVRDCRANLPEGWMHFISHCKDCLSTKAFLDVVDGRTTWRGREAMDRHLRGCWHCVDHFCRMLEVVHLLRGSQPLSKPRASRFAPCWAWRRPGARAGSG